MIDLSGSGEVEICVEFDTRIADPPERRIKPRLSYQARAVLREDVAAVAEIRRDSIAREHRHKMRPLRSDFEPQDGGKRAGRRQFVTRAGIMR